MKGIPEGVNVKDASEVIPPDRKFKYKEYDSYAGFADLFRYKLLVEKGNYWVDSDVVCLKLFMHDAEYVFAGERVLHPRQDKKMIVANCIFKVLADSPIMDYCYRVADNKTPDSLKWGQTGPQLLTRAVSDLSMWSSVADPEVFCPVGWWSWHQFINPTVDKNILNGAEATHLWNEMWRRNDIDKTESFDEKSLYEDLKNTYL